MSNQLNTVLVAKLTDYAFDYLNGWMQENGIDEEGAINEIISSVRRSVEEGQ